MVDNARRMTYYKMIKTGLNARDCLVLEKLVEGKQTPTQLSNELLTAASITLVVDKLVKRKLAKRSRSTKDRRLIYCQITEHGMEVING